eukprot:SAG11_NODE_390_length_9860_cov_49.246184_4_plen_383_part_00
MAPQVVSIVKQYTGMQPMLGLVQDCVAAASRPGILDTSVSEGYPYADVDHMGMSWIAIADKSSVAARAAAQWMAGRAWARREEMAAGGSGAAESLRQAVSRYVGPKLEDEPEGGGGPRGPVVVMDVGDNIGGGSAADSTFMLREAVAQGITPYLQSMFDPAAASACHAAGVGATVELALGGHTDRLHGEPLEVRARVRALSDGRYENPSHMPTHGGARYFDAGLCARVELQPGGQTVLITSKRDGNTSRCARPAPEGSDTPRTSIYGCCLPERRGMLGLVAHSSGSEGIRAPADRVQMTHIGIHLEEYKVIVCKGVNSPIAAYEPLTPGAADGGIIFANTGGLTTADLDVFEYERRVPLYPFEMDLVYEVEEAEEAEVVARL